MLLGFAWQKGWIPLELASILRAIELNEVAIDQNKAAFTWGRRAAHDGAGVQRLLAPAQVISLPARRQSLDELVERRSEFLTAYQDAAYAARYRSLVERVRRAELPVSGRSELAEAVARNLFKLMAYKDEYEVARLYTSPAFTEALHSQFAEFRRLTFYLAPPLLARKDPASGRPRKIAMGGWVMSIFKLLSAARRLRGTIFDPFGYTTERRQERLLIVEYRNLAALVVERLTKTNLPAAIRLLSEINEIRGYGSVKEAAILAYREKLPGLLKAFEDGGDRHDG
jgi:indolepyruvate ferredoxin oxidoreductase